MSLMRTFPIAAALLVLASCGTMGQNSFGAEVFSAAKPLFNRASAPAAAAESATAPAPDQTPTLLGDSPKMLATVPSRGATAVFSQVADNRGRTTWFSADGLSFTLQNGLLLGSRGFGDDLMGVTTVSFATLKAAGQQVRVLEFLDGSDRIIKRRFDCTISRDGAERIQVLEQETATDRYIETCRNVDFVFENKYWIGSNDVVLQSVQLISPGIGHVILRKM